jgi:hypothetical protein
MSASSNPEGIPYHAGSGIDIWHNAGPLAHFSKRSISLHPGTVREIKVGGRVHQIDGSASLRGRSTGSTACSPTGTISDTREPSRRDRDRHPRIDIWDGEGSRWCSVLAKVDCCRHVGDTPPGRPRV